MKWLEALVIYAGLLLAVLVMMAAVVMALAVALGIIDLVKKLVNSSWRKG